MMRGARHLYVKIYAAFLLIVVSSLVAASLVRLLFDHDSENYDDLARGVAQLVVETLPPDGADLQPALERRAQSLGLGLVVWDADGAIAAKTTRAPADPDQYRGRGIFQHRPQFGIVVPLDDGREFGAFLRAPPPHGQFFLWLLLFAAVVAMGCYPLARGITSRVERLQKAARAWSNGALSERAPVQGADEIAELSRTMNHAADRIEDLVKQQKRVLASASHELRSPLARLQLALSLLDTAGPERHAQLLLEAEENIAELNALIEDLLLTARADQTKSRPSSRVDLVGLARIEAERSGVTYVSEGSEIYVLGDAPMLRSLLRNLLENAQRHGGGETHLILRVQAHAAQLVVEDNGHGIPEDQAERIFEPFYRAQGHDEGSDAGVGLGLALVRQIAEHHGGSARYCPREGGGSRFVVVLPLAPELAGPAAHAP